MTTPERLQPLVGLARAKQVVQALAKPDNEVQSVLLYGANGSGKNVLADILAQAWICTHPTELGACGVCNSCMALERNRHADLLEVLPQPPSHLIRLSAVTPTKGPQEGQVSIQEFLRTMPLMARNKVIIVRDAERMNSDAANSFLKTLEEPPPNSKIVLTTSSPGGLLPTILSRCLSVACQLPNADELLGFAGAHDEVVDIFAEGAPGRRVEVTRTKAVHEDLLRLAREWGAKPEHAVRLSERLRELSEAYEKIEGCGARGANAYLLEALAHGLKALDQTEKIPAVLEAHRRILMNGSAGIVMDAMFTQFV